MPSGPSSFRSTVGAGTRHPMSDDDERTGGDERAQREAEEVEKAQQELRDLEEGEPPQRLEDWPSASAVG